MHNQSGTQKVRNKKQRKPQLQMLWPDDRLDKPPEVKVPEGYRLRCLNDGEEEAYLDLMHSAGFTGWTLETLAEWKRRALPGGLFVIAHEPTGRLAATAMAVHNPTDRHPGGGELGWVAAHPDHRGRGLGEAVCTAVVKRFHSAGYRRVYLKTDDFRLPAIRTYLRLGFVPLKENEAIAERWHAVRKAV